MISKRKQEHESSLEDIFAHHDDHLHALKLTSGVVDGDGVGVMRGVPVCVVWSHTHAAWHMRSVDRAPPPYPVIL